MTKKLMILAAGALTALAFAALPAGASAQEMSAHCSAVAPEKCEGVVQSTGHAVLTEDSGTSITCATTTGEVTQSAGTSTTVTAVLTFEGCTLSCQNEGAGTNKIVTPALTGHYITVTKDNPSTAGILLTGVNVTFTCTILGFPVHKVVTGNIIGTFENAPAMCGNAQTHHTIEFAAGPGTGQQLDKTYTGVNTYDLSSNGTTASQTGTAHINYKNGKTINITC